MTPPAFDPALSSVAAARTTLSDLDGERGELVVVGYPIEELAANAGYEEALFLLFEDRLPTDEELDAFRGDLAARRDIDDSVRSLCRTAADGDAAPMDALEAGLAATGLALETADPAETARHVVAVAPTIVATYWRYRQGKQPAPPREDLGHVANYLWMLTRAEPDEDAVRGLETFFVTVAEHGLNTPTFAARTVVSTESDLVSAATAAVGTLKGDRHSGDFAAILDILRTVEEADDPDACLREYLTEGERFPGFGHPVYRTRDPRAAVLATATERYVEAGTDRTATVRTVEDAATDLLRAERPDSTARPTLELYIAPLLSGVGIPRDLFAATFAVARMGGIVAHALEQLDSGRLVRPSARYVGSQADSWLPVDERAAVGDELFRQPGDSLEAVSETLATLSEPSRLEMLLALFDADAPVAYSTLRAATSIEDKGRFNYHLRQLQDYFVADREDGYALTDAGRRVVETVVTDDQLLDVE